ncbi:hypothetical protein P170DRAFT_321607, partial [Aspergillus steynii IBT 23096]
GMGLFAKKAIPMGSVVFSEQVMCVRAEDMQSCRDPWDSEVLLDSLARDMGYEWHEKFLELGGGGERPGGRCVKIWSKYYLTAKSDDKDASVLGLGLAWLNHSCVPNCTLTLVKRHPYKGSARAAVAAGGEFLMPEEPVVTCAVVKAMKNIEKDEEITISYLPLHGVFVQRQMMCLARVNFSCACHYCSKPSAFVEQTYEKQNDVDLLMNCPHVLERRPALVFYAACDLLDRLVVLEYNSLRIAHTWAHIAIIAGFHSDIARAVTFLDKAIASIRALRPAQDLFRRKYTRWRHNLEEMPGFGTSSWGMSTEGQGEELNLFEEADLQAMTLAKPNEYLRVGQYRRLTD